MKKTLSILTLAGLLLVSGNALAEKPVITENAGKVCDANRVDIVYVMDKSGSMSGLEKDVIGGYNTFVDEHIKLDKKIRITTVLFDHDYEVLYSNEDLSAAKLRDGQYAVRGSTALLDALGRSINMEAQKIEALSAKDRPCKIVFVIMTDGEENSSKEFSNAQIKRMVEAKQEMGWEFLFFGANIDAFTVGGNMGIHKNSTFQPSAAGVREANHEAARKSKAAIFK